jgi:hypothetical protein
MLELESGFDRCRNRVTVGHVEAGEDIQEVLAL